MSYSWDNNGNLTNRGSDSFSWDYEDRMTAATVNSVTTSFAYRGDGLRDSRATGGNTTTFTWDIAGGLPVVLDDGSQYVYGAGLTAMKQSGSWYYYLADGLGSTMAILDSSGAVQKGYTYDVYGKPTATGTLANEFDFAGQQTDPTGLQYLRARYMDPETGTFLSREPMAILPVWTGHPFAYGAGNPVRYSDPTGLYPIDGVSDGGGCQPNMWCFGAWLPYVDNPAASHEWVEFEIRRDDVYTRICHLIGEKITCADELSDSQVRLGNLLDEISSAALLALGIKVSFSGQGHWSRHLEEAGISPTVAKATILADVGERLAAGSLKAGPNNIKILIEGKLVEYTAYLFENGAVSVGKAVIPR